MTKRDEHSESKTSGAKTSGAKTSGAKTSGAKTGEGGGDNGGASERGDDQREHAEHASGEHAEHARGDASASEYGESSASETEVKAGGARGAVGDLREIALEAIDGWKRHHESETDYTEEEAQRILSLRGAVMRLSAIASPTKLAEAEAAADVAVGMSRVESAEPVPSIDRERLRRLATYSTEPMPWLVSAVDAGLALLDHADLFEEKHREFLESYVASSSSPPDDVRAVRGLLSAIAARSPRSSRSPTTSSTGRASESSGATDSPMGNALRQVSGGLSSAGSASARELAAAIDAVRRVLARVPGATFAAGQRASISAWLDGREVAFERDHRVVRAALSMLDSRLPSPPPSSSPVAAEVGGSGGLVRIHRGSSDLGSSSYAVRGVLADGRWAALVLEVSTGRGGRAEGVVAGLHVEDPAGVDCDWLTPPHSCDDGDLRFGAHSYTAAADLYLEHGNSTGVGDQSPGFWSAMEDLFRRWTGDLEPVDVGGANRAVQILDESFVGSLGDFCRKYGPRGASLLVRRALRFLPVDDALLGARITRLAIDLESLTASMTPLADEGSGGGASRPSTTLRWAPGLGDRAWALRCLRDGISNDRPSAASVYVEMFRGGLLGRGQRTYASPDESGNRIEHHSVVLTDLGRRVLAEVDATHGAGAGAAEIESIVEDGVRAGSAGQGEGWRRARLVAVPDPSPSAPPAPSSLRGVLHRALDLVERGDVVIMRSGSDRQVRLSGRGLERVEMRYVDRDLRPECPWFTFEGFSVDESLADDWGIVDAPAS